MLIYIFFILKKHISNNCFVVFVSNRLLFQNYQTFVLSSCSFIDNRQTIVLLKKVYCSAFQ